MFVPQEIKARVTAKLVEGIDLIHKQYGHKLPFPEVKYNVRGTTAGRAYYTKHLIELNPVLLMENVDDFIERTVPHELAHLATHAIYPHAHQRSYGQKRQLHGYEWQTIMVSLGADPKRCHNYDVTNARVVKSNGRQVQWHCSGCKTELLLTPQMSAKLRMAPDSRWHKPCRGHRLIEGTHQDSAQPATIPNEVPKPAPAPATKAGTKMEQCERIYVTYRDSMPRAWLIAQFISAASCTPAGANTYYATLKKKHG